MGERVLLEEKEVQLESCESGQCQMEMPAFLSDDLSFGVGTVLFLQKQIHIQYIAMELDLEVLASGLRRVDYGARLEENEDEETVNLLIDFWLEGKDLAITPEWIIPGGINLSVQKMWLEKMEKAESLIFWFVDEANALQYRLVLHWDPSRLETTIKELSQFDYAISEPLN